MVIDVDKIGRSDEQILAQIKADPKVLNLEEMLYAATLVQDNNEKLSIYRIALEAHPQCIRAANNIGYILLVQGKVDEAITALERARNINNNDFVKSNFGFAYLVKGELVRAEEYFNSMATATDESKWGLGVIAITKGQYDAAVNYFGTAPCFNAALAQLLEGNVTQAKATLDRTTETCEGRIPYLKAVIGARTDDRNYMLAGLREAVSINSVWKANAKTDLEFAKFWADDAFRTIVQ